MIPSWGTGNPISKSASGFGLSHEVDKNGCDFLRDSPLSKSFFWFWIKNYFEFCSAKSPLPCIFASTIEIVATPSHRLLPPALSYFTQGIGFWNWFWKTIGKIDLDFKWAISLRKSIPPSLLPSRNRFSKAPPASSMLNLSRESQVCLTFFFDQGQGDCDFQFKSDPMKKIFRGVLHDLLWDYLHRQALSFENMQKTSLSRRWNSNADRQDYHMRKSNSSPSSRPESIQKMVVSATETCVTPSVR